MPRVLLSDRPDTIAALANGYRAEWPDWYGPAGPGDAEADLVARAREGPIPFAVVAFEDDAPVGVAALVTASIASRAQLSPWLGGLWVDPPRRGRGVASRLIEEVMAEARSRGVKRLHVATGKGRAMFERLGWSLTEEINEDGHRLAVLAIDL